MGGISRSRIEDKIGIAVNSRGTSIVYAGGLAGEGAGAEYSYIGTPKNPGILAVSLEPAGTGTESNTAYVGGIIGAALVTMYAPFQYNYGFCDVSLDIGTNKTGTQAAGGLIGWLAQGSTSRGTPNTNYAAGTLRVTNNGAGTSYAGGIAGYTSAYNVELSTCASLQEEITLEGSGTTSWRRIVVSPMDEATLRHC
jgi:hypothetical protein